MKMKEEAKKTLPVDMATFTLKCSGLIDRDAVVGCVFFPVLSHLNVLKAQKFASGSTAKTARGGDYNSEANQR